MRILDEKTDRGLDRVTLYLTLSEAAELRDSIDNLLSDSEVHHEHIPSEDYQKELTVAIYEDRSIESFDERSRRLIKDDI